MNTFYKSEDICIKEDTRNNIVFINFLRSSVSELNYELYHDNIINVYDKYEKLNKKIVLIFDTTKLGTMFSLKFNLGNQRPWLSLDKDYYRYRS